MGSVKFQQQTSEDESGKMTKVKFLILVSDVIASSFAQSPNAEHNSVIGADDGEDFSTIEKQLHDHSYDVSKENPFDREDIFGMEPFRREYSDTAFGNFLKKTEEDTGKFFRGLITSGKKLKSKKKKTRKKKLKKNSVKRKSEKGSEKSKGYFNEYDRNVGGGRSRYNDYNDASHGYFNEYDWNNGGYGRSRFNEYDDSSIPY